VESEAIEGIIGSDDVAENSNNINSSFGDICIIFKTWESTKSSHDFLYF
jgi:hypothetical protein